jgi:hypothetical protein
LSSNVAKVFCATGIPVVAQFGIWWQKISGQVWLVLESPRRLPREHEFPRGADCGIPHETAAAQSYRKMLSK